MKPDVWQTAGRAVSQQERLRLRYQRFDGATWHYVLDPYPGKGNDNSSRPAIRWARLNSNNASRCFMGTFGMLLFEHAPLRDASSLSELEDCPGHERGYVLQQFSKSDAAVIESFRASSLAIQLARLHRSRYAGMIAAGSDNSNPP